MAQPWPATSQNRSRPMTDAATTKPLPVSNADLLELRLINLNDKPA